MRDRRAALDDAPETARCAVSSGSHDAADAVLQHRRQRRAHGRVRRPASTRTLPALSVRTLGDRLDELTGPLLILRERDVGLRDHADEPTVLDNGQPPNLVASH